MFDFGRSKACEGLATWAGLEVGMDGPTPARVAEQDEAREVRDAAWAQYRQRLADPTTYTLAEIRKWLAEHNVRVSVSAVYRDRAPVLAQEQKLSLASEATRRFLSATEGAGELDVLKAGIRRMGQLFFETSLHFSAEELAEAMGAGDVIRLGDSVGKLAKAFAETGLLTEKLAAMRREFQNRAKAASQKSGDGRLSQTDVDEISEAVFGPGR